MPELFDQMLARRAFDVIFDCQPMIVQRQFPAVRDAAIQADSFVKTARFAHWRVMPAEGSSRCGLIQAIYTDCVVRGGTPEPVAHLWFGDVGVSAGVDQNFFISQERDDTQCIGVAVAAGAFAEAAEVGDDLQIVLNQNSDAGVGK